MTPADLEVFATRVELRAQGLNPQQWMIQQRDLHQTQYPWGYGAVENNGQSFRISMWLTEPQDPPPGFSWQPA